MPGPFDLHHGDTDAEQAPQQRPHPRLEFERHGGLPPRDFLKAKLPVVRHHVLPAFQVHGARLIPVGQQAADDLRRVALAALIRQRSDAAQLRAVAVGADLADGHDLAAQLCHDEVRPVQRRRVEADVPDHLADRRLVVGGGAADDHLCLIVSCYHLINITVAMN